MSTFNALNLLPQDESVEGDIYSRELQVEEAFKIYQKALIAFKDRNWELTEKCFEDLFAIGIMVPDKWGLYRASSPILDNLRYLAYRNKGIYLYEFLLDKQDHMESAEVVNGILRVLETLLESLRHGDADNTAMNILLSIFKSFKTKKLQRVTLEHEITKDDMQLVLFGNRRKLIIPQVFEILSRYQSLLSDIKDEVTLNNCPFREQLSRSRISGEENLNDLLTKIYRLKTADERLMKTLDVSEIEIDSLTWESIGAALKSMIPYYKTNNLVGRVSDPYSELQEPIEALEITLKSKPETDLGLRISENNSHTIAVNAEQSPDITGTTTAKAIEITSDINNSGTLPSTPLPDGTSPLGFNEKRTADHMEPRPAQRSSKRFKDKDRDMDENADLLLKRSCEFLEHIKLLFQEANIIDEHEVYNLLRDPRIEATGNQPMIDLYNCITEWNSSYTMTLNNTECLNSKSKAAGEELSELNELLKSNTYDNKGEELVFLNDQPESPIREFIQEINENRHHFHQVRIRFLTVLLSSRSDLNDRIIIKYRWSNELQDAVSWLLMGIELNLYRYIERNPHETNKGFALSIYEILVDKTCDMLAEIRTKTSQGAKVSDLRNRASKLESITTRWYNKLDLLLEGQDKIFLRWSYYCYLQYVTDITDERLGMCLIYINEEFKHNQNIRNLSYPNYRHISSLSPETVQIHSRKLNIIKNITVLDPNSSDVPHDTDKQILQLQEALLTLIDKGHATSSENREMTLFVQSAPFLLQLKLWGILFSFYLTHEDFNNVILVYTNICTTILNRLDSDIHRSQSQEIRRAIILSAIAIIGEISACLVDIIIKNKWKLKGLLFEVTAPIMENTVKLFFLFYTVLYHEAVVAYQGGGIQFFKKAVKSSEKIKKDIINLMTIIVFFYESMISPELKDQKDATTVNLIREFHDLLGIFNFCDFSSGSFLKTSEFILCQYVERTSFEGIRQILWCRYHIQIAGEDNTLALHNTVPVEIDRVISLPLGSFLLKYQFHNQNPFFSHGKMATKQVLDSIVDKIGDLSKTNNHVIQRNMFTMEAYMSSSCTMSTFRKALEGSIYLSMTRPNDEYQETVDAGIYYVPSIQALNFFTTRKKQMQARPSELDSVILMLKNDIIYYTGRFESWYLLGKCYSYIVEDDLIWTSDKLATTERKSTIALHQRKAIMCYLMSINLFSKNTTKDIQDYKIIQKCFRELSDELISAYRKPMEGLCFVKPTKTPIWILNQECADPKQLKLLKTTRSISSFNVEQAMLACLHESFLLNEKYNDNPRKNSWAIAYKISRSLFKASRTENIALMIDFAIRGCNDSVQAYSNKEPVIEAFYWLINLNYKLVKNNMLNTSTALSNISKGNMLFGKSIEFWEIDTTVAVDYQKKIFYKKVIELNRVLLTCDKKKWQHRPQYRIAKILYDDFESITDARIEMDKLISVRTMNKNLVNIWKPDSERPGKHFVYTYQYSMFYIKLLYELDEYNTIGLAIKKLRRFASGMAYNNEAIDKAIVMYIDCIKKCLHIDDRLYLDHYFPKLDLENFGLINDYLTKNFDSENYTKEELDTMKTVYQLKKGTNGIYFDAICISLYLKIFYIPTAEKIPNAKLSIGTSNGNSAGCFESIKVEENTDSTPKQNPSKKKVSKKHIFDKIRLLAERIKD